MKLHVGSGSVYLRDWVNVDLPGVKTFLADERPDLVADFITDESDYYGRHTDKTVSSLRPGPRNQDTVCDRYGSFSALPARPNSVREILSRQVFEHLDRREGELAFVSCRRVLSGGGILRLDLPDPDETIRRYRDTGDDFYLRHLFGPRRDQGGLHTHYTREILKYMAGECGFIFEGEEKNQHFYPAFTLRFMKP